MRTYKPSNDGLKKLQNAYDEKIKKKRESKEDYNYKIIGEAVFLDYRRVQALIEDGDPVQPTNFRNICTELELDWTEIVEPPLKTPKPKRENFSNPGKSDRAEGASHNPMLSSPHTQGINRYILPKLQRFAGRKHIFDEFNKFVSENDRGYFVVTGDPGEGKSTIAAKYVADNPCVYYFNRRRKDWTSAAKFLKNICQQLIEFSKLKKEDFSSEKAQQDGTFFQDLLEQSSACLKANQNLVIVIDALDEVDLTPFLKKQSTILYLPEEDLPEKVYFFLTARRDKKLESLLPCRNVPFKIVDLKERQQQCDDDVREYIEAYLNELEEFNEVKKIINAQQSGKNLLFKILIEKSKRNFMYLTLVLPKVMRGDYKILDFDESRLELEHLPEGLTGYYKEHWVRMGMMDDNRPQEKIYIIYVMSENGELMPRDMIADLSAQSPSNVQWILDNWQEFLDLEPLDDDFMGYAFYHESYNDFLKSQEIIKSAKVDLAKINAEISDRQFPPEILL